MRIVQVNAVYEYSSTGRTTKELHMYLKKNGHDAYVFCNNYNAPHNNIYKIGSSWEYKLHRLLGCLLGLQGYFSFFRTYRMISKIKKISPDVVLLRNLHSNSTQLPMLLKYLGNNKIPTVIVLHDCWFYTGFCTYYTKDTCYKWKTQCGNCPLIRGKKKSWFFDTSSWVYKNKKDLFSKIEKLAVIGVSDWVTNEACQSFLKNAFIIKRIYNWIDLDVFCPHNTSSLRQRLNIQIDDFVVLGVAQHWSEAKGLSLYYKVAEKFPTIKFVMVGGFDNEPLPNMITAGVLKNTAELADYYSMADAFLNFTQQETFGKVTAEALSCGTPIIVNDNTASPELVGDCGVVIPNNDLESCYKAIEYLRNKGKGYFVEKCRKRAQRLFDKEKGLKEYLELFDKITSVS